MEKPCFLLLFFAVILSNPISAQDSLIKKLELLKQHKGFYQYADKKNKKTYTNGLIESISFVVLFTNVKFDTSYRFITIEGFTLDHYNPADTAKIGLCCIEVLVGQVRRKYYLEEVRNYGSTNDSSIDPTKKDGYFSITFLLHKEDRLLLYSHNRIAEYAIGKLLKE
jgi:hypothetical protein